MANTPLPITVLPGGYGDAGVVFTWTPGDNVNENSFQATGSEILMVYNSDVATAGLIVLAVNATGGTFTLTYGGFTTGTIAWNAAPSGASSVQAALVALTGAPAFTVTGVATTSGHTGIYVIQGPVGTVLTALTSDVGSLTGGGMTADIFAGPVGGAGTSHVNIVKSVSDTPFERVQDITDTILPGQYRTYQMFPTSAWAALGAIGVQPASAMLEYVVLRVPS